MALCPDSGLFDLSDACVRSTWAALVPAGFVLGLLGIKFHPPLPGPIARVLRSAQAPFAQFLGLREAEGLVLPGIPDIAGGDASAYSIPVWRPLLAVIGIAQTVGWVGVAAFSFAIAPRAWVGICALLLGASWLYTAVRAATHMSATPPYDLFVLYIVYTVTGLVQLGGYLFEYSVGGTHFPGPVVVSGLCANVASATLALLTVLTMPLNVPSCHTDAAQIVRLRILFYIYLTYVCRASPSPPSRIPHSGAGYPLAGSTPSLKK
jgi:hypothetical protein